MLYVGRSGPVSGRPVSDREERADAGKAGPVAAHLKADGVISGAGHMAVGGLSFPGAEAFSERGVSKSAVFPRLGILRDASDPFPDARFPAGRGGLLPRGVFRKTVAGVRKSRCGLRVRREWTECAGFRSYGGPGWISFLVFRFFVMPEAVFLFGIRKYLERIRGSDRSPPICGCRMSRRVPEHAAAVRGVDSGGCGKDPGRALRMHRVSFSCFANFFVYLTAVSPSGVREWLLGASEGCIRCAPDAVGCCASPDEERLRSGNSRAKAPGGKSVWESLPIRWKRGASKP